MSQVRSGASRPRDPDRLGQKVIEAGMPVAWFILEQIGVLVRAHRADDTLGKAVAKIVRAELVVIDDVGLLPVGADAAEGLYRIIEAAYERRSVAVSSNLHPSGFDELMPKRLATATVEAREEVLLYGLVDWVPLERVHWYVARANDGASMSTIQLQTLEIIRSLVSEGLFEIGELNSDSRFSPWTTSLDESSERIRDHYVKNFDDENSWWFSCWLDLTEKGRQVAEEIEQRLGTIRGLSADDSQAEQRRLAAASSLISVVADHVDDFTAVTGDAVPEWVYRLPLPAGWRSVQINARSNNQPARVAVYGQQPDGGWKATETLSLFRFTGGPPADIVYEKSACTLRDLTAPLGDANAIVGPPTTEVLDTPASTGLMAVRSSGQFVLSQRWTWAQYSTYIAPSEPPDQSLMLQQILHVDSTCREELEADIAQLSDTVLQAFITEP